MRGLVKRAKHANAREFPRVPLALLLSLREIRDYWSKSYFSINEN